jgi:hypothetical protein
MGAVQFALFLIFFEKCRIIAIFLLTAKAECDIITVARETGCCTAISLFCGRCFGSNSEALSSAILALPF